MRAGSKDNRRGWVPILASATLALAGAAALLLIDFGPVANAQQNGGGMITAAVLDRAGAIALPTAANAAANAQISR